MDSKVIADWIQILTGIALVIGLALVIWELQQGQAIAMAQLTSDGYDQVLQRDAAELGEDPASVYAKACADPTSLNASELNVLAAAYGIEVSRVMRAYRIEERSGLYSGLWREAADDSFFNLSTIPGYAYWEAVGGGYPDAVREVGDRIINEAKSQFPRGRCFVSNWQDRIRELAEMSE